MRSTRRELSDQVRVSGRGSERRCEVAETIELDLTQSTELIHLELRKLWPRVIDLNWQLAEDEQSGEVFKGKTLLAKLVHSPTAQRAHDQSDARHT